MKKQHPTAAKKYTVKLAHVKNPDIEGGYWSPPAESGRIRFASAEDFQEASQACLDYIAKNELGSGNWAGGEVTRGPELVARVSYNGKVWPPEPWHSGQKPLWPAEQAAR